MSDESKDPLARAIELSLEFEASGGSIDLDSFLAEHDDLRDILEPLLQQDTTPDQRQILGDFELVRELGRGGMGVVYEAVQTLLGRTVALKLLPPHRALSPRSLAMFRREATLAASLDHPGIAKVLEFQEIDGQFALAMQLVEGVPLDDVISDLADASAAANDGKVRPDTLRSRDLAAASLVDIDADKIGARWRGSYEGTVVELARQVAEALAHAHSRGVVHRDVKPGNILLTPDGTAVLTDFGLAREEGMVGVTRTGEFAGTYQYASPEQLEGRLDEIDGRTDVYALGATLYELLTLQRPLDADSLTELFVLIKREDPRPPSRINSRITPDLEAVILCSLEKEPARRYASAEEFAIDLEHVLNGTPVKARRLSTPARVTRWIDRNRLASSMVLVLVVSTIISSFFWAHAEASAAVADASAKESKTQLERFNNLWVGAAIDAVEARSEAAHPPWPAHAEELRYLVGICEAELLGKRADLSRALADLRRGHVRADTGPRDIGRGPHPAAPRIAELRGWTRRLLLQLQDPKANDAARDRAKSEIAAMNAEATELDALVARSDRVHIEEDRNAAALHDRLEQQLYRLRRLEAVLLEDLRFRRDWAARVHEETVENRKAEWKAAAARVAADERFDADEARGFALAPQVGLVPLGSDPESRLEEFAHPLSGAVPTRGKDGELVLGVEHGVVFVLVPGGSFRSALEKKRNDPSRVRLDPFFIGKHELGRAQWQRLARGLPGLRWRDGGVVDVRNTGELLKPINGVSWDMCRRLFDRYGLDLPTAAQWEYAARFGGGVSATADALARVANLCDRSFVASKRGQDDPPPRRFVRYDDNYPGLAPIASMQATPAGLHHMLGNVSEWCRDAHLGQSTKPRDGDGLRDREVGARALRVICGGDFMGLVPMPLFDRRYPLSAVRRTGVRPIRRHLSEPPQ